MLMHICKSILLLSPVDCNIYFRLSGSTAYLPLHNRVSHLLDYLLLYLTDSSLNIPLFAE